VLPRRTLRADSAPAEFLEETRRRQRELLESEGTPLLPVNEHGSKTPLPRNKHSAGRGGR
jgi:hypothetical protein